MGWDDKKNPPLSEEDASLWKRVTETLDKVFSGKKVVIPKENQETLPSKPSESHTIYTTPSIESLRNSLSSQPYLSIGDLTAVDGSTATKLRKGQYPISAKLDLHGMRQDEAHNALTYFITHQFERRKRCVLVITGKGKSVEDAGVLRTQVPRWLNAPPLREKILGFTYAAQHGKEGALYILLKKPR